MNINKNVKLVTKFMRLLNVTSGMKDNIFDVRIPLDQPYGNKKSRKLINDSFSTGKQYRKWRKRTTTKKIVKSVAEVK